MGRPAPIRITRRAGMGQADWPVWGATVTVMVTDPAGTGAAALQVKAELDEMDAACGPLRPDSELAVANRAGGHPVAVSPVLGRAIEVALQAARVTDGDIDPTGEPDGWTAVRFNRRWGTLHMPAGIRLHLGATRKALAADRAAARVASATGAGVLVSLGHDIATAGPPPAGGWNIRVGAPGRLVHAGPGGLATCAATDPGRAAWPFVSVAAPTCVDARVAATAAVIRGEGALPWLTSLGVAARLIRADGTEAVTGGWSEGIQAA